MIQFTADSLCKNLVNHFIKYEIATIVYHSCKTRTMENHPFVEFTKYRVVLIRLYVGKSSSVTNYGTRHIYVFLALTVPG